MTTKNKFSPKLLVKKNITLVYKEGVIDNLMNIKKTEFNFKSKESYDNQDKNNGKKISNFKTIKIINSIPKFINKDLKTFGPYLREDIAKLPDEIADILIKKNRAEEIKLT